MSISRRILGPLGILVGIVLIISLSRDISELLEARDRLVEEQLEVARLEAEQQKLATELENVMSDEFVEREAREKLLMSKADEVVVILPEGNGVKQEKGVEEEERELANWEKWMALFL